MIQPHITPAYQLAPRSGMRRFLLTWDNSKTRTRDSRKHEKHRCEGVLFSAGEQVRVALSTGSTFATMDEMTYLLSLKGNFSIDYVDV